MVMLVKVFLSAGSQLPVSHVEKGEIRKKMNVWGDLKFSCHMYLPGDLLCSLLKRLCKIKYASEGSI